MEIYQWYFKSWCQQWVPLHWCPSHFLEWTHLVLAFGGQNPSHGSVPSTLRHCAASPCLSSPLFPIWMLAFTCRLCVFQFVLVYSRWSCNLSLSGSFDRSSPLLRQHPLLSQYYMVIVQHTGCLSWLYYSPPTAEGLGLFGAWVTCSYLFRITQLIRC